MDERERRRKKKRRRRRDGRKSQVEVAVATPGGVGRVIRTRDETRAQRGTLGGN